MTPITNTPPKTLPQEPKRNNLSFGLSSSDSEEIAPQIGAFSGEMRGQAPRMRQKRTQDASKRPEAEGVKPKIQVNMTIIRISFLAICLLGTLGLIFMTLAFYEKAHPITGVALLCSTLIPLSLICSYQSG